MALQNSYKRDSHVSQKKRLESLVSLNSYTSVLENKLSTSGFIDGDKLQLAIRREVLKLPARQRAVFSLRYYQDMSYEEIAQILGGNINALKTAYHHAYQKIKNIMEEKYGE